MDTKILTEIGFTQGEIKVYLALMNLGESSIGAISKKAKVTPSKTYPILDKLKEKGLITYVIKEKTKYFQLLNPKRILNYLDDKEIRIQEQKKEITKILPKLKKREESQQYATIYESFKGIKTLYREIIDYLAKTKEDFLCFTLGDEYQSKEANIFFKIQDKKRYDKNVKTKIIGLEHQKKFIKKEFGNKSHVQYRYIKHSIPTGIIVYGDNVVNLLWHTTPTAFVVHSKQNTEAYKKFFWDMWKIAKK